MLIDNLDFACCWVCSWRMRGVRNSPDKHTHTHTHTHTRHARAHLPSLLGILPHLSFALLGKLPNFPLCLLCCASQLLSRQLVKLCCPCAWPYSAACSNISSFTVPKIFLDDELKVFWRRCNTMSITSDVQQCCFCPQDNRRKESPNTDLALCPHCREVFYCSEQHFRLHRAYDGSKCLPFRVVQTEDRGRIVVATR